MSINFTFKKIIVMFQPIIKVHKNYFDLIEAILKIEMKKERRKRESYFIYLHDSPFTICFEICSIVGG